MRETPKRVVAMVVALALIIVFVIGAVELATDQNNKDKKTDQPAATSQPATAESKDQTNKAADQSNQPAASSGGQSEAATTPQAPNSTDLPSTGPADSLAVGLSASAIVLLAAAYWRSRQNVRRWLLQRS